MYNRVDYAPVPKCEEVFTNDFLCYLVELHDRFGQRVRFIRQKRKVREHDFISESASIDTLKHANCMRVLQNAQLQRVYHARTFNGHIMIERSHRVLVYADSPDDDFSSNKVRKATRCRGSHRSMLLNTHGCKTMLIRLNTA